MAKAALRPGRSFGDLSCGAPVAVVSDVPMEGVEAAGFCHLRRSLGDERLSQGVTSLPQFAGKGAAAKRLFFLRLLSGQCALTDLVSSDVSAAQSEVRRLDLPELLDLARTGTDQNQSTHFIQSIHDAHAAFMNTVMNTAYERVAKALMEDSNVEAGPSSEPSAGTLRDLGKEVVMALGLAQVLLDRYAEQLRGISSLRSEWMLLQVKIPKTSRRALSQPHFPRSAACETDGPAPKRHAERHESMTQKRWWYLHSSTLSLRAARPPGAPILVLGELKHSPWAALGRRGHANGRRVSGGKGKAFADIRVLVVPADLDVGCCDVDLPSEKWDVCVDELKEQVEKMKPSCNMTPAMQRLLRQDGFYDSPSLLAASVAAAPQSRHTGVGPSAAEARKFVRKVPRRAHSALPRPVDHPTVADDTPRGLSQEEVVRNNCPSPAGGLKADADDGSGPGREKPVASVRFKKQASAPEATPEASTAEEAPAHRRLFHEERSISARPTVLPPVVPASELPSSGTVARLTAQFQMQADQSRVRRA